MRKVLDYDSLFDHHFYSCKMGVKKPDTKYFDHIVSNLNLPASQLLYIDDKESNVSAAKQVGLQAVCFDATLAQEPANTLLLELQQFTISL